MSLWRILREFFDRHRRTYALAVLCLLAVGILNLLLPWWVGRIVDALAAGEMDRTRLIHSVLALLLVGVSMYGLRYLWRVLLFGTAYRLGVELRAQFYAKLLRLDPGFYQRRSSGDLLARATQDIDAVEFAAGEGVLSSVDGAMTLMLVLGMMLISIDAPLTLVAIVPFPLMAWGFYRIAKRVQARFGVALERFSRLNERTQEAFSGIRTLKSHALIEAEIEDFEHRARATAEADFQVQRMEARYEPVVFIALASATLLTLVVGSLRLDAGALTLGGLTSFTLYLVQLIWPMFAIGWCLNLLQRGEAGARRLFDVFDETEAVADHGQITRVDATELSVEIERFAYPGDAHPTLEGISLRLAPGQTVGVVGHTGSGKSTLLKLLMRQYPLEHGRITLGGEPIEAYRLDTLRTAFAYVPQDAFLFAASLADNLRLGRPDADQQALNAALAAAAFEHDLNALPQGLETPIGERGVTLSGGQRQRVALARALLKDAPILLLDDTLSAVDYATERRLLATLNEDRGRRTRLIVSHRLSAVAAADQILVLDQGRVVERGSHAELLSIDGLYAALWREQAAARERHPLEESLR
ncbi:ABC transporter ATP-binding protein [Halotalea alkalilenta]|uniref:ABC transporter ATP-binding protein n=1 Tax=Halotalea alkalilenta TaxID=376489 RepID=UPI0005B88B40|nr:ABC transporter transmembrane domain-containing protein [Halotalea alkalilenta]